MKMRWGEAAGAILTLMVFVALPLAAMRYLPPQTLLQLEETGLDIQGFANQMVMLGLVIAALIVGKALTASEDPSWWNRRKDVRDARHAAKGLKDAKG